MAMSLHDSVRRRYGHDCIRNARHAEQDEYLAKEL
jgi:hypothetical protein